MARITRIEINVSDRDYGDLSLVNHEAHLNGSNGLFRRAISFPGHYWKIMRNRFHFFRAYQIDFRKSFFPTLGSSKEILIIDNSCYLEYQGSGVFSRSRFRYDAVITNVADLSIIFLVADCPVISLFDREKRVMANVHAGREETFRNISGNTVRKMRKGFGCDPKDIVAYFSPHICPYCHKLAFLPFDQNDPPNQDIAEIMLAIFPGQGVFHFDLRLANELQLRKEGVGNIFPAETTCTLCGGNHFSHRGRSEKNPAHPKFGRFAVVARML